MLPQISQKITDSKSILLVVPSEADWAAIYYAVALSLSYPDKEIAILNNDLFFNTVLISKLEGYKYTPMNTGQGSKFSIVIDKTNLQIKQSDINETEQSIKLSFESGTNTLPGFDSIKINRDAFCQELCIVIQSSNYKPQNNYKKIISGFEPKQILEIIVGEGRECGQILALNAPSTNQDSDNVSLSVLELLTISIINQTIGLSTALGSDTFIFISNAIEKGIDYQKCYSIAQENYNQTSFSIIKQSINGMKELEEGIYSSIIEDSQNILNINTNLKPIFSNLGDCKIAILIIARNIYRHIYIVNKSSSHTILGIKDKFNGVGDNNYIYFKSKKDSELLERIIKELLFVNTNTIEDLNTDGPRFTQGLNIGQEC
jgi:hypothetical protein